MRLLLDGERVGSCTEYMSNTTPRTFENVKVRKPIYF